MSDQDKYNIVAENTDGETYIDVDKLRKILENFDAQIQSLEKMVRKSIQTKR